MLEQRLEGSNGVKAQPYVELQRRAGSADPAGCEGWPDGQSGGSRCRDESGGADQHVDEHVSLLDLADRRRAGRMVEIIERHVVERNLVAAL